MGREELGRVFYEWGPKEFFFTEVKSLYEDNRSRMRCVGGEQSFKVMKG